MGVVGVLVWLEGPEDEEEVGVWVPSPELWGLQAGSQQEDLAHIEEINTSLLLLRNVV